MIVVKFPNNNRLKLTQRDRYTDGMLLLSLIGRQEFDHIDGKTMTDDIVAATVVYCSILTNHADVMARRQYYVPNGNGVVVQYSSYTSRT